MKTIILPPSFDLEGRVKISEDLHKRVEENLRQDTLPLPIMDYIEFSRSLICADYSLTGIFGEGVVFVDRMPIKLSHVDSIVSSLPKEGPYSPVNDARGFSLYPEAVISKNGGLSLNNFYRFFDVLTVEHLDSFFENIKSVLLPLREHVFAHYPKSNRLYKKLVTIMERYERNKPLEAVLTPQDFRNMSIEELSVFLENRDTQLLQDAPKRVEYYHGLAAKFYLMTVLFDRTHSKNGRAALPLAENGSVILR